MKNKTEPENVSQFRALFERHRELSLEDPLWKRIYPKADVNAMFQVFDDEYFEGKLRDYRVYWSNHKDLETVHGYFGAHDGIPSIFLSSQLHTISPREELIHTLLHEMIHAYLYFTGNCDGHGKNFQEKMNEINQLAKLHMKVEADYTDAHRLYEKLNEIGAEKECNWVALDRIYPDSEEQNRTYQRQRELHLRGD